MSGLVSSLPFPLETRNKRKLTGDEVQRVLSDSLEAFLRYRDSDGSFYILMLDSNLTSLLSCFTPILERRGRNGEERIVGYDIAQLSEEDWLEHWSSSREAANYIRYIITVALEYRASQPLPEGFLRLAERVVFGHLETPRKTRRSNHTAHRNYLMAATAHWVTSRWETSYAVDKATVGIEGNPKLCGATIAAACAHALGEQIAPKSAVNICNNNKIDAAKALSEGSIIVGNRNALAGFCIPVGEDRFDAVTVESVESAMRYLGLDYPKI